jgi:peptidoglycan/LPS O-acetylase OafA/YrhL
MTLTMNAESTITQPTGSANVADRLDWLDGIRGIACLVVVLTHSFGMIWKPGTEPKWAAHTLYGYLAVIIFLCLSGYCLTTPIVKTGWYGDGVLGFYRRRALRILPPYYVAVAISIVIAGVLNPTYYVGNVWKWNIFHHIFFLQGWTGEGGMNSPLWSIPIEIGMYALMPLFVLFWRRFGTAALLLGICPASALLFSVVGPNLHFKEFLGIHFAAAFAFGMVAAVVAKSASHNAIRLRTSHLLVPAAVLAAITIVVLRNDTAIELAMQKWPLVWFYVVCAFGFLLLIAVPQCQPIRRILSAQPIRLIGVISYSLYLIHFPILLLGSARCPLWCFATEEMRYFTLVTLVSICVIAAVIFHVTVEKPCIPKRVALSKAPGLLLNERISVADTVSRTGA